MDFLIFIFRNEKINITILKQVSKNTLHCSRNKHAKLYIRKSKAHDSCKVSEIDLHLKTLQGWVWWLKPVIPALGEAEVGG